jgi:hypothetical protein
VGTGEIVEADEAAAPTDELSKDMNPLFHGESLDGFSDRRKC